MFKKKFLKIITVILVFLTSSQGFSSAVKWFEGSFDEALATAHNQNKPIFLVIHAEWCGPCEYLLETSLENPELASFVNSETLPFLIDGDLHREFESYYKFVGYPTIIVTRPSGEEISRLHDDESFLQDLKESINHGETISELKQRIVADPTNANLKASLFEKYCDRINSEEAFSVFQEIKTLHPEYYSQNQSKMLYATGRAYVGTDQFELAKPFFVEIISLRLSHIELAYRWLSVCYPDDAETRFSILADGISVLPDSIYLKFDYMFMAARYSLHLDTAISFGKILIERDLHFIHKGFAYYLLALVYFNNSDKTNALQSIDNAIALDPDNHDYRALKDEIEQSVL